MAIHKVLSSSCQLLQGRGTSLVVCIDTDADNVWIERKREEGTWSELERKGGRNYWNKEERGEDRQKGGERKEGRDGGERTFCLMWTWPTEED